MSRTSWSSQIGSQGQGFGGHVGCAETECVGDHTKEQCIRHRSCDRQVANLQQLGDYFGSCDSLAIHQIIPAKSRICGVMIDVDIRVLVVRKCFPDPIEVGTIHHNDQIIFPDRSGADQFATFQMAEDLRQSFRQDHRHILIRGLER